MKNRFRCRIICYIFQQAQHNNRPKQLLFKAAFYLTIGYGNMTSSQNIDTVVQALQISSKHEDCQEKSKAQDSPSELYNQPGKAS